MRKKDKDSGGGGGGFVSALYFSVLMFSLCIKCIWLLTEQGNGFFFPNIPIVKVCVCVVRMKISILNREKKSLILLDFA